MQPEQPSSAQPVQGRAIAMLSLAIAILWLVASAIAGAWLFTSTKTGAVHLTASKPTLSAQSTQQAYGGDAYTGIQNAASDKEHAVVDGTNGLYTLSQGLADSSAAFNRGLTNRLQQGLGLLIIGVGILNFTVALSRFTGAPAVRERNRPDALPAAGGAGARDLWGDSVSTPDQ